MGMKLSGCLGPERGIRSSFFCNSTPGAVKWDELGTTVRRMRDLTIRKIVRSRNVPEKCSLRPPCSPVRNVFRRDAFVPAWNPAVA